MRFLICEWTAYMQTDLEDCLHAMGIETVEYGYRINNFEQDDYFYRSFKKILENESVDAVMMMNYMAPLVKLCAEFQIPYISWVYDCPFGVQHPEETLGFPTNHVFFFDRAEASNFISKGYENVYHLPLAVNTERIDQLFCDEGKNEQFASDISFVGIMYGNQAMPLLNRMPEYERGYLDGLFKVQSELYGSYILHECLDSVVNDSWKDPFSDMKEIMDTDRKRFLHWIEHSMAKEITRQERIKILRVLSKRYKTSLYTPFGEEMLPDVINKGVVSAYDEAPYVYHNSKINLNITLKDLTSGIPLRVMEILGSGGFLLSNWQPEIAENFIDGEEVVLYDSVSDAISKAIYYLEHEDERVRIAAAGRRAVERFSFENQVETIIKTVFPQFDVKMGA